MKKLIYLCLLGILLVQCDNAPEADLILKNGNFYTVDASNPSCKSIAIKDGKILELSEEDLQSKYAEGTKVIDLNGGFAMPGFIEGHGHFSGLGKSLINLNFLKSKNWNEIVSMIEAKAKTLKPGEWVEGRGWHQEKWDSPVENNVLGYPYHDALSAVTPDNPVILFHASGHGLFANEKAMELAGISIETPNPLGGEIVRDSDGRAIGVFEETAMRIIRQAYQNYLNGLDSKALDDLWHKGIDLAEEECLKKGITSFQDAGSLLKEVDQYEALAKDGNLDLRLWAMVRQPYDSLKGRMDKLPMKDIGDGFFTCRAIKAAVDGALGSYGAWLLESYDDKPNFMGQNVTTIKELNLLAEMAMDKDMQYCVHAIGDRGNREVLDIMEKQFTANPEKENLRWRIEHAQHLHPEDIPRFRDLKVIASMQGIHCTSDAPFVEKRLGYLRAKIGAYAWRTLLDNDVQLANGTDAPVEDVDPIPSFYASVTRKRIDNGFEFFTEQKMTRAEAIHSYTLGNAYAAFEEEVKGSLEVGKYADIVVLSEDLMNCSDEAILDTKVLYTIV
ncbi:MAG: amidohydrolase, partial [Bacteroidota bacterium]